MADSPRHSVSVAAAVFDEAERVLLIKRSDNGQWQAPGGVLELGETFEQGVRREVEEETGLLVEVEVLTGIYKNLSQGVVAIVYRCRPVSGALRLSDETSAVDWFDMADIEHMMVPAFAIRVTDALNRKSPPASRAHNGQTLVSP